MDFFDNSNSSHDWNLNIVFYFSKSKAVFSANEKLQDFGFAVTPEYTVWRDFSSLLMPHSTLTWNCKNHLNRKHIFKEKMLLLELPSLDSFTSLAPSTPLLIPLNNFAAVSLKTSEWNTSIL